MLYKLPTEILCEIGSYLDYKNLTTLRFVNKYFYFVFGYVAKSRLVTYLQNCGIKTNGFNNLSNPIATTNNEDFKITNGAISIFTLDLLHSLTRKTVKIEKCRSPKDASKFSINCLAVMSMSSPYQQHACIKHGREQ